MEKHTRSNLALWLFQIAVAALFVAAGIPKLAGVPVIVQMFDTIGVGQWLRYVTGLIEVGGGVLLLVPALAGIGAVVLAIVMTFAVLTHVFVLGGSPAPALVLLAATLTIAWFRRAELPLPVRA